MLGLECQLPMFLSSELNAGARRTSYLDWQYMSGPTSNGVRQWSRSHASHGWSHIRPTRSWRNKWQLLCAIHFVIFTHHYTGCVVTGETIPDGGKFHSNAQFTTSCHVLVKAFRRVQDIYLPLWSVCDAPVQMLTNDPGCETSNAGVPHSSFNYIFGLGYIS